MPIRPAERANVTKEPSSYAPAINTEYSRQYREDLFLLWYQNARPRGKKFAALLPKDEHGRIPNLAIVQRWMREDGWMARANEMDGEVIERLREIAIAEKVNMHQRHAEVGKELLEMGLDWLESNHINTATEASRIIELGTRLEKENTGGAQALQEVSELSNRKLHEVIGQLMGRTTDDDIEVIEAEIAEE